MKKFLVLMLLAVAVLLSAVGDNPEDILSCVTSIAGNTPIDTTFPFTTDDNEDNALSGNPDYDMDEYLFNDDSEVPIEFNIFVEEAIITDAQLSILAWDIDETSGEIDEVYLNGHYLGALTGANNQWSTTVMYVDPSFVNPGPAGQNLVQIYVDVENIGNPTWAVEVNWGQFIINNSQGSALIRYVELDNTCYYPCDDVAITIEVDTSFPDQEILVETNILDDNGVNIDGTSRTVTIVAQEDDSFVEVLNIPCNTISAFYTIQVIVYGHQRCWIQQDIETVVVEDCNVPVTLSSFTAIFDNSTPTLQWTTQSESNNLGWNIYRSVSENLGQASQINNLLIPGNGTTSEPTAYVYNDLSDVASNTTYWYWLESASNNGETEIHGPVTLTIQDDENQLPDLPTASILHDNYPNPFNPSTMINFSINTGETGSLTILNAKGQVMESHEYDAGEHQFSWDATNYSTGIYFYKLETPTYTNIKKMIMVK